MWLKSSVLGNAVGGAFAFACMISVAPMSWGQQPGSPSTLNAGVRADVLALVKDQQAKSFLDFQKDPAAITFTQAQEGIRRNLTRGEFDSVVNQTRQFYKDLKVTLTIQIPTPDKSGVLSFDCVPENMQPALAPASGLPNISYVRPIAPIDPDRPTLPPAPSEALPPQVPPQPSADPAIRLASAPGPSCPVGTVPIPRISAAEGLVPGFKNMLQQTVRPIVDIERYRSEKGLATIAPPAVPFQHRWAHAVSLVPNHGAASRLNVWRPKTEPNDMSLSQIWVVAGGDGVRPLQTVEAGWQVMSLWQSPFATVFAFSSTDNYGPNSCYATKCKTYQPPVPESFVLATNKVVVGAPVGAESIDGGKQSTVDVKWVRRGDTGAWWLQVNSDWIGYYPKSSFNGGPLSAQADYVDFGGETAGMTPSAQMGSGRFAEDGAGHAAFQSRIRYFDLNDKVISPVVSPSTTDAGSYSITLGGQKEPEPQPGTFIFFGGPGNGFFGTAGSSPAQANRSSP